MDVRPNVTSWPQTLRGRDTTLVGSAISPPRFARRPHSGGSSGCSVRRAYTSHCRPSSPQQCANARQRAVEMQLLALEMQADKDCSLWQKQQEEEHVDERQHQQHLQQQLEQLADEHHMAAQPRTVAPRKLWWLQRSIPGRGQSLDRRFRRSFTCVQVYDSSTSSPSRKTFARQDSSSRFSPPPVPFPGVSAVQAASTRRQNPGTRWPSPPSSPSAPSSGPRYCRPHRLVSPAPALWPQGKLPASGVAAARAARMVEELFHPSGIVAAYQQHEDELIPSQRCVRCLLRGDIVAKPTLPQLQALRIDIAGVATHAAGLQSVAHVHLEVVPLEPPRDECAEDVRGRLEIIAKVTLCAAAAEEAKKFMAAMHGSGAGRRRQLVEEVFGSSGPTSGQLLDQFVDVGLDVRVLPVQARYEWQLEHFADSLSGVSHSAWLSSPTFTLAGIDGLSLHLLPRGRRPVGRVARELDRAELVLRAAAPDMPQWPFLLTVGTSAGTRWIGPFGRTGPRRFVAGGPICYLEDLLEISQKDTTCGALVIGVEVLDGIAWGSPLLQPAHRAHRRYPWRFEKSWFPSLGSSLIATNWSGDTMLPHGGSLQPTSPAAHTGVCCSFGMVPFADDAVANQRNDDFREQRPALVLYNLQIDAISINQTNDYGLQQLKDLLAWAVPLVPDQLRLLECRVGSAPSVVPELLPASADNFHECVQIVSALSGLADEVGQRALVVGGALETIASPCSELVRASQVKEVGVLLHLCESNRASTKMALNSTASYLANVLGVTVLPSAVAAAPWLIRSQSSPYRPGTSWEPSSTVAVGDLVGQQYAASTFVPIEAQEAEMAPIPTQSPRAHLDEVMAMPPDVAPLEQEDQLLFEVPFPREYIDPDIPANVESPVLVRIPLVDKRLASFVTDDFVDEDVS